MKDHIKREYHPEIDILRILSILAVVMIHTTTRTLEFSRYNLQAFQFTLFLNQISRFAVPLFFMISGYVLELRYPFHASYLTYIKKRINKIFIPYVFWSAVYYFLVYKQHAVNFFQALLTGNASYQLYFIPTLLIFYFLFPLLHRYYHYIAKRFVLVFLLVIQCAILFYDYYIHPLPFYYPISIALLNFYFFIAGSAVSHHRKKLLEITAKWKIILSMLVIFFMWFVFFEGKSMYEKTQNYLSFYSQWRPSIMLYTCALGSILFYFFSKNVLRPNIVLAWSRLIFFVFFIHVIILELVWHWYVIFFDEGTITRYLGFDVAFFGIVAGVSFIIAFIIHKIPYISKITG